VAILGDLKFGRTVHSLIKLLSLYDDLCFRLFAPPSLELPGEVAQYAVGHGHHIQFCDSVVEAVRSADAVYATRVQRERMTEELAQANARGDLLNWAMLAEADALDAILMHPLPRDSRPDSYDMSTDVDDLPGLAIFHQTDNGLNIRMAIFLTALGVSIEAVHLTTKLRPWKATLRP
jgi:aspartate carbamoyltransferase catalytic subunit